MTDPTPQDTPTPAKRGVPLTELTAWLDTYLRTADFKDWSNNGLQVEGNSVVTRVAASVDTSERSIEDAIASGANLMIVHHGLFWNKPLMVTGPHRRRLQARWTPGSASTPRTCRWTPTRRSGTTP